MRGASFVGGAGVVGAAALAASSVALSAGGAAAFAAVGGVGVGRAKYAPSPARRICPPPTPAASRAAMAAAATTTLRYADDDADDLSDVSEAEIAITSEEREFLARTEELCRERNLPLEGVKNARDLASVSGSPVRPGRIYRTGRVSDASHGDISLLFDELGVKTLVDLRSPTELKDDPTLEREAVFKDFVSVVWRERGRDRDGKCRELEPGQPRIRSRVNEDGTPRKRKTRKEHVRELLDGIRTGAHAATHNDGTNDSGVSLVDDEPVKVDPSSSSLEADDGTPQRRKSGKEHVRELFDGIRTGAHAATHNDFVDGVVGADATFVGADATFVDEECAMDAEVDPATAAVAEGGEGGPRRERHFVSMMNELKYVRGTLSKLRKRDIARALLHSPPAAFSRRSRARVKDVFLSEINGGGLPLLNELLLRYGAPGIRRVLELCADRGRHPVAFYCTAGKDRTGVVAAVLLSALGVPDEDIVEDYSLSANVYAEMDDHKAMVGALSQRNLDAKTFLGAPPEVMRDTLEAIRENYGSVEGYLDWIGFDEDSRERLREALLEP